MNCSTVSILAVRIGRARICVSNSAPYAANCIMCKIWRTNKPMPDDNYRADRYRKGTWCYTRMNHHWADASPTNFDANRVLKSLLRGQSVSFVLI